LIKQKRVVHGPLKKERQSGGRNRMNSYQFLQTSSLKQEETKKGEELGSGEGAGGNKLGWICRGKKKVE